MQRLNLILNTLSRLDSQVSENLRVTHKVDGKVDALTGRVDRIEDREHQNGSPKTSWTPRLSHGGLGMILILGAVRQGSVVRRAYVHVEQQMTDLCPGTRVFLVCAALSFAILSSRVVGDGEG